MTALGGTNRLVAAPVTPGQPRIPQLGTTWIRVCAMPDLGELNGDDPTRQHVVDHGFVRDGHGRWQLWACIRGTATGQIFYGWEGPSLQSPDWAPMGVKLRADARFGERMNPESVQAPHFLKIGDVYHGFYDSAGIRLLTSRDGVNFARALDDTGNNVLYHPGGRDVMVLAHDGKYSPTRPSRRAVPPVSGPVASSSCAPRAT